MSRMSRVGYPISMVKHWEAVGLVLNASKEESGEGKIGGSEHLI